MARTKQTPRNPNVDRPVAAVGSDIQSAEDGQLPDPHKAKCHTKEASSPVNIYPKRCCTWVPHQLEESRILTIIGLDW